MSGRNRGFKMSYNLNYKQEEILNKIIKLLENNDLKWVKNWFSGIPKNYITKKEYKGINAFILNINNIEKGFKSPYYLTFLQIKNLKGHLNAGSQGQYIFYYQIKEYIKENKAGEQEILRKPLLRVYYVFNIEQTNIKIPTEEKKVLNPIENAENLIKLYTDIPRINAGIPSYNPKEDLILIPNKNNFNTIEDYYSTLYHELSHSTGHEKRLNRDCLNSGGFLANSGLYSKEEIIAELSNSFLCGFSGIENKTLLNNTAYIQGWLKNLKEDKTFLFKVIKEAQKSADYIRGIKPNVPIGDLSG